MKKIRCQSEETVWFLQCWQDAEGSERQSSEVWWLQSSGLTSAAQ